MIAAPLRWPASQAAYLAGLCRKLGPCAGIRFRCAMLSARLGLHRGDGIWVRHRSLAHPAWVRIASSDADVFGQVVMRAEYAAVAVGDPRVIVDCGANAGYTSAFFLSAFPLARVIAIEPFAENAALCRRNLAAYGDRATVIEAAAWGSPCRLVVEHSSGNEWGASVRPAKDGEAGDVDGVGLPSLGLGRIDILKVDVEGSEAELFADDPGRWLGTVANMAIEVHGPRCEAVFRQAMAGYRFREAKSGELTVCLGIAPDAVPPRTGSGAAA